MIFHVAHLKIEIKMKNKSATDREFLFVYLNYSNDHNKIPNPKIDIQEFFHLFHFTYAMREFGFCFQLNGNDTAYKWLLTIRRKCVHLSMLFSCDHDYFFFSLLLIVFDAIPYRVILPHRNALFRNVCFKIT